MAPEPMIATAAVDLNAGDDAAEYPVHIRVDDEALYVDIHVGDAVLATMVQLGVLNELMDLVANLKLPQFGAPRPGGELLN